MQHLREDIQVVANVELCMRERGKLVQGSQRIGHNVFTTTGRNWLSKLMAWQAISTPDVAFTQRRGRWIGVGTGNQLESQNVSALVTPAKATPTDYLMPIESVEFPTSTSVRFTKEFGLTEITVASLPVSVTEIGLFVDVNPVDTIGGVEDVAYAAGTVETTLNPALSVNPPVAYKAFDAVTKTIDFILEVKWDLRLG